ncbi:4-galactosyl-N-acetylglucosaminide 3-alpha-L-fucosyltransferase 9-like [Kryptolebias marmoratus]|uniref:Fucosyltransferase n=1 Tax=Kryptolebias marmoratus TaxID=37003 RepID=A0A3Q3FT30_KRYMA|nr:4-galactosyl-N-acetylglucosaminide 3-alpha-L-fucosyltransferase 9-like [Kryptolebias marmoratus]XP_017267184.1 4-galactosyl-N-acetylglucosaminide 3-alpha-L-fucosyltransferase 9-like [Kryptolebias marmoratus]XP_017267193.1 4-galactosyl-N-acetylglucosaminide 3-alpha-L-fucosyltransferase 9-like [Kryptolebias marmoratus]XP_017267202.1 4-galactosyl-N-acetylglucosaminide 3-alpha-L-fucosyltransferase 9-like [Kryptolebias marmoratus]XP_024860228.1 4-galactosyl-N-acetylglucosaminide 3-alpha-L-fucosyl
MSTNSNMLRPLLISIFVLGCFATIFFMYFKPSTSWLYSPVKSLVSSNQDKSAISTKSNESVIIILLWFWPFGARFKLDVCSSQYNIEGCLVTADRNLYNKSHGVVIHHRDIAGDLSNLPSQQRPPFQKWIWLNLESPVHSPRLTGLNSLFNLTLNYRQDSDIRGTYGTVIAKETKEDFVPPSKNKLVCWIVSNWSPNHARAKYYNELKKYVDVHVYGQAFGNRISGEECQSIVTSCKFYLSFENSIFKDYITEKFYRALSLGTVPVVLGPSRQNYENFIQGDSFIHVNDFPSPKELAEYLLLLDKNEYLYKKYFKWRRHFTAHGYGPWARRLCDACAYLKKHNEYKSINDFIKWYWG